MCKKIRNLPTINPKLVVFGSVGGSRWDWFCGGEKSGRTMWLILHCTSQTTIDMKVNLSLHLLFLCPKRVCSTHLTFTFLWVLHCLSVSSAVLPVMLGWRRCRLLGTLTRGCLKVHGSVPLVLCLFVDPLQPRIKYLVFKGTMTLLTKSSNIEYWGQNKVSCTIFMISQWIFMTLWWILPV